MTKSGAPWVVVGGKHGEAAHCTRCGEGLNLGGSQPLYLAAAMMRAFAVHHGDCQEGGFNEPTPEDVHDWFRGRDTGTSSLTIYSVFTYRDSPHRSYSPPRDPDDFGRCYRLLKLAPNWRPRLEEVATAHPEWKPFVDHWDEMTALYEEELPAGICPKLYALMQQL